ncbi:hypothetical protein AWB68_02804 [Caballeronia choica]|uniref:Uncharacterized protein n=1 Tax=Caballeronia choica TaxID=326476 RepID=A0A158ILK0_9BURK|nr:hypothetical protein AWB68_02804 [Caballeronia choica]
MCYRNPSILSVVAAHERRNFWIYTAHHLGILGDETFKRPLPFRVCK